MDKNLKKRACDLIVTSVECVVMVVTTCLATEMTNTAFKNLDEACYPKKKSWFKFNIDKK